MKNKVVKNLATSFCKVSEENLDGKLKKSSRKESQMRVVPPLRRARRRNPTSFHG
jgi:hypothetical protein